MIAIALVRAFFRDVRRERRPVAFGPMEIFRNLRQVTRHPAVMRLMPGYACFMVANVTLLHLHRQLPGSAFGYGVVGGSAVMLVIGCPLAFSSTFLVKPAQERFDKTQIIRVTLAVWAVAALAVSVSPIALLCFVPVFVFYFCFGVAYPTILGLFSGSVGEAEQGWVMGITTAVFTLAGGTMSLIGGGLMVVDIRLPFYITAAAAVMGWLLVSLQSRGDWWLITLEPRQMGCRACACARS